MFVRQEVQYYEKMEVRDIRNDMPLAAACQDDVERYCKDIKSGALRPAVLLFMWTERRQ